MAADVDHLCWDSCMSSVSVACICLCSNCIKLSVVETASVYKAGGGKIELVRLLTIMLKLLLYTCQ